MECRRVFARGMDKFDVLTVEEEDEVTALATILGSNRRVPQVTTYLKYEDALVSLESTYNALVEHRAFECGYLRLAKCQRT